jgi:uncharacterized membrane protein
MLGTAYPLMDVFISTLYFVLFIFWLILAWHVFYDLFRSRDLSGVAKTVWVLGILIFPLLGCLLYLLIRGGKMHQHEAQDAATSQKAFEDYIRQVANTKE